jgi:hypothetical protein
MAPTGLSESEKAFAMRMLPHFMSGKSAHEAAKSVLDDDARLFDAFCDRSHSYFVDIGDGRSARSREGKGDVIAKDISAIVYSRIRATIDKAGPGE